MFTFPEVTDVVRSTTATSESVEKVEDVDQEGYSQSIRDLQVVDEPDPQVQMHGMDSSSGPLPLTGLPASSGSLPAVAAESGEGMTDEVNFDLQMKAPGSASLCKV